MDKQLELFKEVGGHYLFAVDSKQWDFIAYNVDAYQLTEEEIMPEDLIPLTYKELAPTLQKLKSEAWSSNCRWFFVLQDEGIYLMNVYDNHFWLCRKHSHKFIQMYLNASTIKQSKAFSEGYSSRSNSMPKAIRQNIRQNISIMF